MNNLIFFRQKSYASPLYAPDGEIESGSNILLKPVLPADSSDSSANSGSSSDSGENSGSNLATDSNKAEDILTDPNRHTRQLDNFATNQLPIVEFGVTNAVVAGWHNHPDNPPTAIVDAPKNREADGWKSAASSLLAKFIDDAGRHHLFTTPFFALSAIRLADGSHILPSSPVLLNTSCSAPTVEGSDNFALDTMQMSIPITAAKLRCRITLPQTTDSAQAADSAQSPTSADRLADQIVAIDIFVSDPINLYDTAQPLQALHRPTNTSAPMCWLTTPLSDAEFTARLLAINTFRRISSIAFDCIPSGTFDVDFNAPLLIYTPDYLHHSRIEAASGCSLSGRTTLCDLTLTLPAVPRFPSLIPLSSLSPSQAMAELKVVKGTTALYSTRQTVAEVSESDFPKWLFIPEPDAKSLSLVTQNGTFIIPLQRHPLLNGSYFWGGSLQRTSSGSMGVTKLAVSLPASAEPQPVRRDSYRIADAIWRSAKNSPFLFPDRLLLRLSVGRVIAECRAFRASGLVATTAPTAYLFSTAGIFLLKETDNGKEEERDPSSTNGQLKDAGLIANYILDSPQSIDRLGKTLEFTDINGTRLCISGTVVKPLSGVGTAGNAASLSDLSKWQVTVHPEDPDLPIELVTRPLKLTGLLKLPDLPPLCGHGTPCPYRHSSLNADMAPHVPTGMPLSLSALMDYLRDISVEGAFLREGLTMSLYGSRDLVNWKLLAQSGSPLLKGLFLPGLQYARIKISGHLHGSLAALRIT